jgi:uncharacterized protein with NAD-binding domain and iron-sulfur cluster
MSIAVRDVIVVGGGLAELSAAVPLAGVGAKMMLLDRRSLIGGRIYSYNHTPLGETIDSQRVVVGACTNVLQLCRQAGIADAIRWYDELTFLEPAQSAIPGQAARCGTTVAESSANSDAGATGQN